MPLCECVCERERKRERKGERKGVGTGAHSCSIMERSFILKVRPN